MTEDEIRAETKCIAAIFEVKIRHHRFFERLWSNCTSGQPTGVDDDWTGQNYRQLLRG